MQNIFDTPIEYLKGIGSARGAVLREELNIHKYGDLMNFYPNRYIDKTKYYKINELQNATAEVQIVGKIIHLKTVEFGKAQKRLVADFVDDTGKIELVWFQGIKTFQDILKINEPTVAFGKAIVFNNKFTISHPEIELVSEHKTTIRTAMQPVYPSTEMLGKRGFTNRLINGLMINLFTDSIENIQETLPQYLIDELKLVSKKEAIVNIHFPKSTNDLAKAQFRLKFEELFYIQLQLITKNLVRKHKIKGHAFEKVGDNFNNFFQNHLPFNLTNAQKRVVKEIRNDMGRPAQMNRLLQGDVGSGKTIVAFLSMLLALDNGFQACLMAPTEILAQQHFVGLSELAIPLGLNIKILTGSSKIKQRRVIHEELENGLLQIIIGTHALLEDVVKFKNLGLAIIDEQHRFGVEQRSKLWKKNNIPPHVLVMTATPIPRTLAMSLYGDLDISVIDELPPGRKPIVTEHRFEASRLKVLHFMKAEIAKGRQIYVVFPLIQESEKMDFKNLIDGYNGIVREFPSPQYAVSIVHGQLKPEDKNHEMQRFVRGETNIMVATTVIEVGVNVPNASVMIIESAERFGLSQLHQLRGRVGRGADQSYCILMTSFKMSNDTKTRMETMVRTNDGFEIAEVDLKLRGPGDLMGKQQSGVLNLQIADIVRDRDILIVARNIAVRILQNDAPLEKEENKILKTVFIEMAKKSSIWNYIS